MAIKLETKNVAPAAVILLEIKSQDGASSVVLGFEEVKMRVGEGKSASYVPNPQKMRQSVSFIGFDGFPVLIEGVVPESQAIEISAAFKVVVQVTISNELKVAYEAGRVSQGYMALNLVRVVEVWDSPKNKLWAAKETASAAVEMDESGRLKRV
jgi:hypothetical protein